MASPLTLITVTNYRAVTAVLDQLAGDLSGTTLVVLCTGTPAEAQVASDRAERMGAQYVDAGVQTQPADIGTKVATILYSGSEGGFSAHRHTLELLGTPRFVGSDPTAAAVWDLVLFGLWYDAQVGLLRAFEAVNAAGIDLADFTKTAQIQLGHVVDSAAATATEVAAGDYPRGPADLNEHLPVLGQLVELRRTTRLGDGGLQRVHDVVTQIIDDGHGHDGLTALLRRQ